MGITLESFHIFSDTAPEKSSFFFRSFSAHWQTCIDDFSALGLDCRKAALQVSQRVTAPVLHFQVFDSEMIWLTVYQNGNICARHYDNSMPSGKKISLIPDLFGCSEKRRLYSILSCSDTELKIAMLEEYLGVCLLFEPDLMDDPQMLHRDRDNNFYLRHQEAEKALTSKAAPYKLNLIAQYPGKIFRNSLSHYTTKPHHFLWGFQKDNSDPYIPVHFTGKAMEVTDIDNFEHGFKICSHAGESCFECGYFGGGSYQVKFLSGSPAAYLGKTMNLPAGFYPFCFTDTGRLLLWKRNRICVVDDALTVVANLSVKGDIADMVGDYILTTTGESFCGHEYEPRAAIYIYQLTKQ